MVHVFVMDTIANITSFTNVTDMYECENLAIL